MIEREQLEAYKVDRTGWAPGPWDREPDRRQWIHAGYACLMVRNYSGNWCGYVGVDRAHPCYAQDPFDCEALAALDVHQGLTYGAKCDGAICHAPEAGMPADVWWLGFHCGHMWDRLPGFEAREKKQGLPPIEFPGIAPVYRAAGYVQKQVERLAEQLRALAAAIEKTDAPKRES